MPTKVLPMPQLGNISDVKTYILENEMQFNIISEENPTLPFDYSKIFGQNGYKISYKLYEQEESQVFTTTNNMTLPISFLDIEYLYITPAYEKSDLTVASSFQII